MGNNIIKPELFDQVLLEKSVIIPDSFSFEDVLSGKKFAYTSVTECVKDSYFKDLTFFEPTTIKIITTRKRVSNKELVGAANGQNAKTTFAVIDSMLRSEDRDLNKLVSSDSLTIVIPVLSEISNNYGDYFCLDLIGSSKGWFVEDSWIHRERYSGISVAILL